jgi:hypothetical protein
MAEGFQVQLQEKREMLETARRRALQTKDDELAAQFIRDAEELNGSIHRLEVEYAETREKLDTQNAGNTWIDAAVERRRRAMPGDVPPTVQNIKDLSYDDRRRMLEDTGLCLWVYPTNWHEDGKRVEAFIGMPWDRGADPEITERFKEWIGPDQAALVSSLPGVRMVVPDKKSSQPTPGS